MKTRRRLDLKNGVKVIGLGFGKNSERYLRAATNRNEKLGSRLRFEFWNAKTEAMTFVKK